MVNASIFGIPVEELPKLHDFIDKAEEDAKERVHLEWLVRMTEQHTNCAVCGILKHTPVRRDSMGGYVCGGCLDNKINELEAALNKEQL